jgi:hypothetical protein
MSQLELLPLDTDSAALDRLHHDIRFVLATVAEIANSLPIQRRPLTDGTRLLHCRVTWLRRNGYCPCCQQVRVCDADGRLQGSEYDHFFGRHRNGPQETWLICAACNRDLELPASKSSRRSEFEAYQRALLLFLADGQTTLFP